MREKAEANQRRNPVPDGGSSIQLQLMADMEEHGTLAVRSSDSFVSREAIELIEVVFILKYCWPVSFSTSGQNCRQEKIQT